MNLKSLKARREHLWATFGITLEAYDKMLRIQDGRCVICGITAKENIKRLAVDHDHKTNEIRGLLCMRCNAMLGYALDRPWILRKAANYLEGRVVFGGGLEENVKLETFVPFEDIENIAISNVLHDQIVASLTDDEYNILMAEYGDGPPLAKRLGITEVALSKRRQRIREKLLEEYGNVL